MNTTRSSDPGDLVPVLEPTGSPRDPVLFRRAMGRFVTGVTVVAAGDAGSGTLHGATVSAFLSVSEDPPMVGVCLANRSRLLGLLTSSDRCGISLLAADQDAEAWRFAGRPPEGLGPPVFAQLAGAPVLVDAVAQMAGSIVAHHPAGDHTLFLVELDGLAVTHRLDAPLVYYSSAFHVLASRPTSAAPVFIDAWHGTFNQTWG